VSVYAVEGTGEVAGDSNADESEKIKELVSGAGGWLQYVIQNTQTKMRQKKERSRKEKAFRHIRERGKTHLHYLLGLQPIGIQDTLTRDLEISRVSLHQLMCVTVVTFQVTTPTQSNAKFTQDFRSLHKSLSNQWRLAV